MKMAMIPSPDDVKGGDFDLIMECKADGYRTFAWLGAVSGNMLDPRNWQEILNPPDVIPGNVCLAVGPNHEIIRAVYDDSGFLSARAKHILANLTPSSPVAVQTSAPVSDP